MPHCSVARCKYRATRGSSVRLFQVPQGQKPFLVNQRRLWQQAVREANGGAGTLLANPRVCAAHFTSGEASLDFESPDFVPSVFPSTPERKTRSQEIRNHTQGIMTRSQESQSHISERTPPTLKRKTSSQEIKSPESQTHVCTPETEAGNPECNACSQESRSNSQGIMTRSQESKIRLQQRENRKRRRNWIFGSHKSRQCRARSKPDESAPNVHPSALKRAQSEEEEQRPFSPAVVKEEEMSTDAEETPAAKVSLRSGTPSGPDAIPPLLPPDIKALLRRRPVVRLKRFVVPGAELRRESCGGASPSSPLLLKHKEVRQENLHFICEICGVSFTAREEFTAHQSNHPKLEPYFPCNVCDRSFSTVQQMKRHKLLHVRDGRRCLKCGTLFCQRHHRLPFQPQPRVKSECQEEAVTLESPEVKREVTDKREARVTAEMVIPPATPPVVMVSVIPLRGLFHERPLNSPSLFPRISFKTLESSPRPRYPLLISLPPPPPPAPSLPSPFLNGSSGDVHPSTQPKAEEALPPPPEPFVPKACDFPPSLKMFSPRSLTSALLEVERNYEHIFNGPKRFKGGKEGSAPPSVSSGKRLLKPGMRRRVAYDLEVVL